MFASYLRIVKSSAWRKLTHLEERIQSWICPVSTLLTFMNFSEKQKTNLLKSGTKNKSHWQAKKTKQWDQIKAFPNRLESRLKQWLLTIVNFLNLLKDRRKECNKTHVNLPTNIRITTMDPRHCEIKSRALLDRNQRAFREVSLGKIGHSSKSFL